jgi:hypothetical protein
VSRFTPLFLVLTSRFAACQSSDVSKEFARVMECGFGVAKYKSRFVMLCSDGFHMKLRVSYAYMPRVATHKHDAPSSDGTQLGQDEPINRDCTASECAPQNVPIFGG